MSSDSRRPGQGPHAGHTQMRWPGPPAVACELPHGTGLASSRDCSGFSPEARPQGGREDQTTQKAEPLSSPAPQVPTWTP